MARAKEFDYEKALEKAKCVFWEKGYEATSIQGLVQATGVNRASLREFRRQTRIVLAGAAAVPVLRGICNRDSTKSVQFSAAPAGTHCGIQGDVRL